MTKKISFRMILVLLIALILISALSAIAAANSVPNVRLSDQNFSVTIYDLAPPECDSIRSTLEAIVVCTTTNCSGNPGNNNELILGTSGNDTIDGGNGDDCIVGGGGDDTLNGNNGNDVLVGGPGSDFLYGDGRNKDYDICIDDPATTYFDPSCEYTP